jgi:hypothetical protein
MPNICEEACDGQRRESIQTPFAARSSFSIRPKAVRSDPPGFGAIHPSPCLHLAPRPKAPRFGLIRLDLPGFAWIHPAAASSFPDLPFTQRLCQNRPRFGLIRLDLPGFAWIHPAAASSFPDLPFTQRLCQKRPLVGLIRLDLLGLPWTDTLLPSPKAQRPRRRKYARVSLQKWVRSPWNCRAFRAS